MIFPYTGFAINGPKVGEMLVGTTPTQRWHRLPEVHAVSDYSKPNAMDENPPPYEYVWVEGPNFGVGKPKRDFWILRDHDGKGPMTFEDVFKHMLDDYVRDRVGVQRDLKRCRDQLREIRGSMTLGFRETKALAEAMRTLSNLIDEGTM